MCYVTRDKIYEEAILGLSPCIMFEIRVMNHDTTQAKFSIVKGEILYTLLFFMDIYHICVFEFVNFEIILPLF